MAEQWRMANIERIKEHKETIYIKFCEGTVTDDYGNVDASDWLQKWDYEGKSIEQIKLDAFKRKRGFKSGFSYFWKNVLVNSNDADGSLWFKGWDCYRKGKFGEDENVEWHNVITEWIYIHALRPVHREIDSQGDDKSETADSDDLLGENHVIHCESILREAGWNVEQTQASNDQGVDLIAQIEDLEVCIQCKRYSNPVGNKAVQEVIAGKAFYNGTHAVVVSNAGFTKAAKNLAESADVLLISDTDLEDLETMV